MLSLLLGGFNHLEKYESMGRINYPVYEIENKKWLKPPTSWYIFVTSQWLICKERTLNQISNGIGDTTTSLAPYHIQPNCPFHELTPLVHVGPKNGHIPKTKHTKLHRFHSHQRSLVNFGDCCQCIYAFLSTQPSQIHSWVKRRRRCTWHLPWSKNLANGIDVLQ